MSEAELSRIRQKLECIANKTMAQKYAVPPLEGRFFEWVEGKGMISTPLYLAASREHKYIDMQYPIFDWQQGVGFYALLEAGRVLGTSVARDFVYEWLEGHAGQPGPRTINTTAPFLSVLELQDKGGQRYREWCEQRARFCMAEAARADEGAFEHTVIGQTQRFRSQIWADTLFVAALFLARWGRTSGNAMYLEEALRQLRLHYRYLCDPETGLMYHAYNCTDRTHLSRVKWGRANVWGIHAGFRILEQLPEGHPGASEIQGLMVNHLDALVQVQAADGSLHTVLDDRATAKETTATAGLAYGLMRGVRLGWLNSGYQAAADRALSYLLNQVAPDGEVRGCSGGTPVMASAAEYDRIPMVMSYYGQGLAMLALVEALGA